MVFNTRQNGREMHEPKHCLQTVCIIDRVPLQDTHNYVHLQRIEWSLSCCVATLTPTADRSENWIWPSEIEPMWIIYHS